VTTNNTNKSPATTSRLPKDRTVDARRLAKVMITNPLPWSLGLMGLSFLFTDVSVDHPLLIPAVVAGAGILLLGVGWAQLRFDQRIEDISKTYSPRQRVFHTGVAIVLSLLLAGVGQGYNRQFFRGLSFLIACYSIYLFSYPLRLDVIFLLWSVVDAGVIAWRRTTARD
jgi:xanthine/uracil permease